MARGNPEKIKPTQMRSGREAREKGALGGKKSGEARREKRRLREILEMLLERPEGDCSTAEAISVALINKALSGDVKAYETVRDTIGEKPVERRDTVLQAEILTKEQRDAAFRGAMLTGDE